MALGNEVSNAISGAVFSLECVGRVFLMRSDVGELKTMVLSEHVVKEDTSFGVSTREVERSGGRGCVVVYGAIETGDNTFGV